MTKTTGKTGANLITDIYYEILGTPLGVALQMNHGFRTGDSDAFLYGRSKF